MPDPASSSTRQKLTVRLLTTGGTIASRRDPATGAVAAAATGAELLDRVPGIHDLASIDVEAVCNVNGWNMTPALMMDLAHRVGTSLDATFDGAVITHGTDTVEETAFLLDLLIESPKQVVFAIALRHLDELDTDGPRNLHDAALVATSPAAHHRGTLLVANQTIHTARDVTKLHTTNPNAFGSPARGPIGWINGDEVVFARPAFPRWTLATDQIEERVLLIPSYAGQDGSQLRWAIEAGYRGFVVEGTGAGNVPATMVPSIETALAMGIPVVLTSRVPSGPLATAYGGGPAARGGGYDLAQLGVIPAPNLPGHKARLLLMAALGRSTNLDNVREVFRDWASHQHF